MSIGVPIKVLHEAEGHIVTCETNTGEVYRGKLIEAEDNMNCQVLLNHNSFLMHCIYVIQTFTLNLNIHFVQGVVNNETNWAYVLFDSDVQHYSDISRWQSVPAGAGIHSRQQNTLPHSTRHVEKTPPCWRAWKTKNQGAGAGRGKAAILKAQGWIFDFITVTAVMLCFSVVAMSNAC